MTNGSPRRESDVIDELADRYRAAGYKVTLNPKVAGEYAADLLLERGSETVLVDVRNARSRSGLRLGPTAEVAAKRGWRFEVVLFDDDRLQELKILPLPELERLVSSALQAEPLWAPVALTAALEAIARYSLAHEGIPTTIRPGPLGAVQALASRGLLLPEEEKNLRHLIQVRHATAHGFTAAPPTIDLEDSKRVVRRLFDEAKRIEQS